jgi:hypothetical protein
MISRIRSPQSQTKILRLRAFAPPALSPTQLPFTNRLPLGECLASVFPQPPVIVAQRTESVLLNSSPFDANLPADGGDAGRTAKTTA